MTPAAGWTEASYWQARRDCHRAWVATQPQYVIPGLLDELDTSEVKRASDACLAAAASLVSSPSSPGLTASPGGGLDSTTTGSAADPALDSRGAAQKGA